MLSKTLYEYVDVHVMSILQVVMFIRASRETHSGELILKIRPNGKNLIKLFSICIFISQAQPQDIYQICFEVSGLGEGS